MSFCPNCGQKIAEGEAFCSNCGTKFEPELGAATPAASGAVSGGQPQVPPAAPPPESRLNQVYQTPMPPPSGRPNYQVPPAGNQGSVPPNGAGQGYQAPFQSNGAGQGYQAPFQSNGAGQGYQVPFQSNGAGQGGRTGSDTSKNLIIGVLAAIIIIGGGAGYYLHAKGSGTPSAKLPAQTETAAKPPAKPAEGAADKNTKDAGANPVPSGEIKPVDNRRLGTITGNEVIVRSGNSTSSAQITDLDQGTQVEILETRKATDRRAAVVTTELAGTYNGQPIKINRGYGVIILRDYGDGTSRCQLTVDNQAVYMKINNANLSSIYGQTWYKVRLEDGRIGWVFGDFLQPN